MTSSLNLRQYRPGDSPRVIELHEEALREAGGFVEGAPEPDLEDVEQAYLERGGEFLVGEVDGRIVAMGAFRPVQGYITGFLDDLPDATAEIKRMRVDPDHQRQGYGQLIYEALERQAGERGYTDLVLDTTPQQVGAQRFYERNSFEEVERKRVRPGEQAFEMIFYRKSLTETV